MFTSQSWATESCFKIKSNIRFDDNFWLSSDFQIDFPVIRSDAQQYYVRLIQRLNMKLDIQSLFGLLCTAVLIG